MAKDKDKIKATAQKFVQKGQIDKAIKAYQEALTVDKKDIHILLKLGDLSAKKKNNDEAMKYYADAAKFYTKDGFYSKAVAIYKQILQIDPNKIDVNEALADLYNKLGLINDAMAQYQQLVNFYEVQGQMDKALETLKRMAEQDPRNVVIITKLAEMYYKSGKKEDGYQAFRKALDTLKAEGRMEQYTKLLEKLAKADPDNNENLKELNVIYLKHGTFDRAYQVLGRIYKNDPEDLESLNNLANVCLRVQKDNEAAEYFKALAGKYNAKGLKQKAKDALAKVMKINPADPDAIKILGKDIKAAPEAEPAPSAKPAPISRPAPSAKPAPPPAPPAKAPAPAPAAKGSHLLIPEEDEVETEEVQEVESGIEASDENIEVLDEVPEDEITILEEPEEAPSSSGELSDDQVLEHLTEAEVYLKYGLRDKALHHIQIVLSAMPNNIKAHAKLKDLYVESGEMNKAIEELRTISSIAQKQNDIANANAALQQWLQIEPGNAQAQTMLQELKKAPKPAPAPAPAAPPRPAAPAPHVAEAVEEEEPEMMVEEVEVPAAEEEAAEIIEEEEEAAEISDIIEEAEPEEVEAPAPVAAKQPVKPVSRPVSRVEAPVEEEIQEPAPPAAEVKPPPPDFAEELEEAEFYIQQGLYDEAKKLFLALLKINPGHAQSLQKLAEVELKIQQEAEKARAAAKIKPAAAPAPAPPAGVAPAKPAAAPAKPVKAESKPAPAPQKPAAPKKVEKIPEPEPEVIPEEAEEAEVEVAAEPEEIEAEESPEIDTSAEVEEVEAAEEETEEVETEEEPEAPEAEVSAEAGEADLEFESEPEAEAAAEIEEAEAEEEPEVEVSEELEEEVAEEEPEVEISAEEEEEEPDVEIAAEPEEAAAQEEQAEVSPVAAEPEFEEPVAEQAREAEAGPEVAAAEEETVVEEAPAAEISEEPVAEVAPEVELTAEPEVPAAVEEPTAPEGQVFAELEPQPEQIAEAEEPVVEEEPLVEAVSETEEPVAEEEPLAQVTAEAEEPVAEQEYEAEPEPEVTLFQEEATAEAVSEEPVAGEEAPAPEGRVSAGEQLEQFFMPPTEEPVSAMPEAEPEIGQAAAEIPPAPDTAGDLFAVTEGEEEGLFDLAAELEGEDFFSTSDIAGMSTSEQAGFEDTFQKFKEGVASQISEEDWATHYDLGIAYKEMALIDDAIGEFKIALKSSSIPSECLMMIGICQVDKGELDKATQSFWQGTYVEGITNEHLAALYNELGKAYLMQDQPAAAKALFEKTMEMNPLIEGVSEAWKQLADISAQMPERPAPVEPVKPAPAPAKPVPAAKPAALAAAARPAPQPAKPAVKPAAPAPPKAQAPAPPKAQAPSGPSREDARRETVALKDPNAPKPAEEQPKKKNKKISYV